MSGPLGPLGPLGGSAKNVSGANPLMGAGDPAPGQHVGQPAPSPGANTAPTSVEFNGSMLGTLESVAVTASTVAAVPDVGAALGFTTAAKEQTPQPPQQQLPRSQHAQNPQPQREGSPQQQRKQSSPGQHSVPCPGSEELVRKLMHTVIRAEIVRTDTKSTLVLKHFILVT